MGLLSDRMLSVSVHTPTDVAAARRACDRDPVGTAMVGARLEGRDRQRGIGGELWTTSDPTQSLCFSGANLIPIFGNHTDMAAFAERAQRTARQCSSVVGYRDRVLPLWEALRPQWGAERALRDDQPLMELRRAPQVAPDPLLRGVRMSEIDRYAQASIAMFTAEVGIDPTLGDNGRCYRNRLASHINSGRAYARFDGDTVVFKAEIGTLSRQVGQIQGVWVHPDYRGQGYGAAGTAALADIIRDMGRVPTLYVNSFNTRALATYRRIGFRQVGTFATVLID